MSIRAWLISIFLLGTSGAAVAGERSATFAVACYDVGKQALSQLRGVRSVSTGWSRGHEVDTVRYDEGQVTVAVMEDTLRRAGTFIKTLEK